jgi:hypothetical protein
MSKAVMYTGADPELDEDGELVGEFQCDTDVTDVAVGDGLTEIRNRAFCGCMGLKNLSFLKDSAITTIGDHAFRKSGITYLHGMEGVKKIGYMAFAYC